MAAENGTLRAFRALVRIPDLTRRLRSWGLVGHMGLGLSGRGRGAGPEGKLHRDHAADRRQRGGRPRLL